MFTFVVRASDDFCEIISNITDITRKKAGRVSRLPPPKTPNRLTRPDPTPIATQSQTNFLSQPRVTLPIDPNPPRSRRPAAPPPNPASNPNLDPITCLASPPAPHAPHLIAPACNLLEHRASLPPPCTTSPPPTSTSPRVTSFYRCVACPNHYNPRLRWFRRLNVHSNGHWT